MNVRRRAITTADSLTVLRHISLEGDLVKIIAYEGPPGIAPLIFDLSNDAERIERLRPREVVATRTHAVVNLKNRDVVVEYNQRGAKARDIAELLAAAGRSRFKWSDLTVELPPVASPDFAKAVDEFETIKIASLNIVRPNLNWVKEKNHADALAAESNGQRVEISIFAGAGDGLVRQKGIVKLIKGLTGAQRSQLRNASISGRRKGETSDTTISLERHLQHRNVRIRLGEGGHPESSAVVQRIIGFLQSRDESLPNDPT